ncbi:hypothetical protein AGMMS50249_3590 [candidate division SR1 bacterium]|nr:hypothetical protein AGMMS50249_3590 [candidate division SR1 bacterium]
MLFDFLAFIDELRENEDKKEIVEKYESLIGPIQGNIIDQVWYREYLSRFPSHEYLTPEEFSDDFDRDILQKLIIASFSNSYTLSNNEKKRGFELSIGVESEEQTIVKTLSELWAFQISRLFEIYIEEQMNHQIWITEGGDDKETVLAEREMKIKRRKSVLDSLNITQEAQKAQVEQEAKLDDLMGQL